MQLVWQPAPSNCARPADVTAHTVLLDVDTGTDDALAILYAVAHPDLAVAGISCVAGNAPLPRVLANTAQVLDAAGAAEVPIAGGAARPLLGPSRDASHVHGASGLGGVRLPDTTRGYQDSGATTLLRDQILAAVDPVTLVALAPQTNLALLLTQYPEVADRLDRIVFMGGSAGIGNATPVAEFNVWHDPEAAAMVINSGITCTMYALDVFMRLVIAEEVARRLAAASHPARRLAGELLQHRFPRADGRNLYHGGIGDAGALVLMTNPELFRIDRLPTQVNLTGIGRGQTIVDQRHLVGEDAAHGEDEVWPQVDVALDLDARAAAAVFVETIERYVA